MCTGPREALLCPTVVTLGVGSPTPPTPVDTRAKPTAAAGARALGLRASTGRASPGTALPPTPRTHTPHRMGKDFSKHRPRERPLT